MKSWIANVTTGDLDGTTSRLRKFYYFSVDYAIGLYYDGLMIEFYDKHGYFVGTLPDECISDCSAPGQDASEAVAFWQEKLEFNPDPDQARRYLRWTGGWTADELDEMSELDLAHKILWLACCDLRESGEYFGMVY